MRGPFALRGAARCVFRPRIVEGTQVDLLRVLWQMLSNRGRKIFDGHVRQKTSLRVDANYGRPVERYDARID
jgi:hypothetical protein